VEAVIAEKEAETNLAHSLEWRLRKVEIMEELPTLVGTLAAAESSAFRPAALEAAFGIPEFGGPFCHPEPIPLDLPIGETILLKGRIDRLELAKDGRKAVRALDYKTGACHFSKDEELRAGDTLQAGLYLLAANKITGCEIDDFSESGYLYLMGKNAGTTKFFKGEKSYQERVRALVAVIVNGIKAGLFCPAPNSRVKRLCDTCDIAGICGPAGGSWLETLPEDDPVSRLRSQLDEFK
jgi:ATP-dependent helicase/DNAse subunit B